MGIHIKLAAIMAELERVPETGQNVTQHYRYATDSDISDAIRVLLGKHGVSFMPTMTALESRDIVSAKGTAGVHIIITFEYTFCDGETGEIVKSQWYGESEDYGDKAISKAATLAQKSFLKKVFVISTGDPTEDPDNSDPEPVSRRAPSAKAQAQNEIAAWTQDPKRIAAAAARYHGQGLSDADLNKAADCADWKQTTLDPKAFDAAVAAYVDAQVTASEAAPTAPAESTGEVTAEKAEAQP